MNSWIHASAHCGEKSSVQDKTQIPKSTQGKVTGLVIRVCREPGEQKIESKYLQGDFCFKIEGMW